MSNEFDEPRVQMTDDVVSVHTTNEASTASSVHIPHTEYVHVNYVSPAAAAAADYVAHKEIMPSTSSASSTTKRKYENDALDFKRKRLDEIGSYGLFEWLEKWFAEVRERRRDDERLNKLLEEYELYVPHLVYCVQHKRFSSPETPVLDRDESCRICLHKELALSPKEYHSVVFPCSDPTREGMERDRKGFSDAWGQYVNMIENVENIHIADSNRQRMRRSLITRWVAFQQQAIQAARRVRSLWSNGITTLDANEAQFYKEYFNEAIIASVRYHRVNVFRMMCLTHRCMVDALPTEFDSSKYESCQLCRSKTMYKPTRAVQPFHRDGELIAGSD